MGLLFFLLLLLTMMGFLLTSHLHQACVLHKYTNKVLSSFAHWHKTTKEKTRNRAKNPDPKPTPSPQEEKNTPFSYFREKKNPTALFPA